jgi:hypothetical protein
MACFDRKDRDFYNSLTDEERKKFSNYLMIRWGSSVQGSRELQEFYVKYAKRAGYCYLVAYQWVLKALTVKRQPVHQSVRRSIDQGGCSLQWS